MNTKNITVTDKPLLNTNLDTNFLKLVAIISMFIDHVGAAFFPEYPVFRWLGRLAFPIFCYCMTVGMLYTSNIRRYLGRLGLFAVISQPFWILAFNPQDILGNLTNWNIFFTLFISLLAVWGFKEKKWCLLMLVFYLCRKKPSLGAVLYVLLYLPAFFTASPGDPLSLTIGNYGIGFEAGALLALPLIFLHTNTSLRIPKWFFYAFYPAHLALIALVRFLLGF